MLSFILFAFTAGGYAAGEEPKTVTLIDLKSGSLPANMSQINSHAELVNLQGKPAVKADFKHAEWPQVLFTPTDRHWDWSEYGEIRVVIYNPGDETVPVCLRVDNPGADGVKNCATQIIEAPGKKWSEIKMNFRLKSDINFWGMRGTPEGNNLLDSSQITACQIFLPRPNKERTLYIRNIELIVHRDNAAKYKLPFVDKFGQNKFAEYPGKLKTEAEWKNRIETENKEINRAPAVRDRDKFGGWAQGPKLDASGWFRTAKIDGRWWLVTPEGYLFFSLGINTVTPEEATFIDDRDGWFEELPDPKGKFEDAYGYTSSSHSMAEAIGGKGKTFGFYIANQIRKYGANWKQEWRKNVFRRLPAWGFNTIGNWSRWDILGSSPVPYTATGNVGGNFRVLEAAKGYWGYLPDFFDPEYAKAVEASLAPLAAKHANNIYCIGYFVDNEMAWEAAEQGTLLCPTDQPCRIYLIDMLKEKYTSIENLNRAWGTSAANWDELRNPANPNKAFKEDMDRYIYLLARQYFSVVKNTLNKYAPNHLYLGCRFAWSHPQAIKACADVADVVSVNVYDRGISADYYTDLGKPLIIGEFHFGALDRGMLHTGLVATANQDERAQAYADYVKSVAQNPAFVGCHWFEYIDEPLTGRWLDGENYNIGFVDITDTPYPEMVAAAKKINAQVYEIHNSAKTD